MNTNNTLFSVQLSEQWLLERTYHAQLLNGKELSVDMLTQAMQELSDTAVPLSSQSSKSRLPQILPTKKSRTFSIPISTWQEITQEEARVIYQQGTPILLYGEHTWKHTQETPGTWSPNHNMRAIIFGNTLTRPEATSGTEYAVCYLDIRQGIFSNASWKTWFSSDPSILFNHTDQPGITFFRPCVQFPFTTHYTVIAPDGSVSEYPGRAEALQGFVAAPIQEEHLGNAIYIVAPHFYFYHEVTCPSGTYRLEFFGPHMNERGYMVAGKIPVLS